MCRYALVGNTVLFKMGETAREVVVGTQSQSSEGESKADSWF